MEFTISSFKLKLKLLKSQLSAKDLKNFKNLNSVQVSEKFKFNTTFDDYIADTRKIESKFGKRFQDIKKNGANSAMYVISVRKSEL